MERKQIIHFNSSTLEDFRFMVEQLAGTDATHVVVSDLPRSMWMWDIDRNDPYPNWSMGQCPLFKLACPEKLKQYLPQDHISECMDIVKARCEILRQHGLKPAILSNEPFWLPEQVYRDHPQWRGARCDHPPPGSQTVFQPQPGQPGSAGDVHGSDAGDCAADRRGFRPLQDQRLRRRH